MSGGVSQSKLESIQILRAAAAFLVVLWHLELVRHAFPANSLPRAPQFLQFGYAGVELFFIISGYIIMHVTDRGVFDVRAFLLKRFVRIYPIYIAFTLVPIIALVIAPGLRKEGLPALHEIVASLAIFPQRQAPLLGPGWSLEHEIIFYLLVAALLAVGKRRLVVPILLTLAGVGAVVHGLLPMLGMQDVWDWHLFSPFQFGFALGALIYQNRGKFAAIGTVAPLILGLLLVAWCAVAIEPYRTGGVWAASGAYLLIEVFGFSLAFSLIVLAMLNLERSGALKAQAPLVAFLILVGDASYVLYLFNYLFMVAVWKALLHVHLPGDLLWLYMACALAVCVLGAVAIHLAIERPYLRFAEGAVRAFATTLRLPKHSAAVEEIPKA